MFKTTKKQGRIRRGNYMSLYLEFNCVFRWLHPLFAGWILISPSPLASWWSALRLQDLTQWWLLHWLHTRSIPD